ncbi:quinohemoprotein amine dehydrogenase subunit alpha [Bacillus sp. FJAT-45350]|uniref:quinohemoprotein amine dehydrogenase subunit alpha n=1 Tax=Bacillus sp. FJAT-45350 TaxID=2011014 RepID=UPI000BB8EE42|nr:quinohemoprotein amine dehydrogenase subunit alpha [Bacillus sp. FJAT-45350]
MKKQMKRGTRWGIWSLNLIILLLVWTACSNQDEVKEGPVEDEPVNVVLETEYSSLIQSSCLTCHAVENGKAERISDIRKTPEGWDLTISRMQDVWGLDITHEEKREIIKELSHTNGLAPAEMEESMYWITREGTTIEDDRGVFAQSCLQCHSIGQPLAQRRTDEEWDKLKDFHVAFNPAMIYQLRAVDWDEEAGRAIKYLQENYGFHTKEYEEWQGNKVTHNPAGEWRIVGISPTYGMYTGTSTFTGEGDDFREERTIAVNGEQIHHKGNSILYSGYSLRTSLDGEERFRGYYNFDRAGKKITGSRVKVGDTGIYANEVYYPIDSNELLDVWPKSIQKGIKTKVHIAGSGLPENIALEQIKTNDMLQVSSIEQQNDDLWLDVEIQTNVTDLVVTEISVEGVSNTVSITLFNEVDFIKVTPEYGLGRYGDEHGRKSVQFQAIAYSFGPDGIQGTEDDVALGPVQANWSMTDYSSWGEEHHDDQFIGKLDEHTGMFEPAGHGPNPEREWNTNNAGGVNIHAVYVDPVTGEHLSADGFLLSTVPDFVPKVY